KLRMRNYRPWFTTREIPLTLFAVAWFLLCTFLTSLVNVYLDRTNPFLVPPPSQRLRLPDPLLDAIYPEYLRAKLAPDWPDTLVHVAPVIMLLRVVLGGKEACWILRQLGYMVGTGYLIRLFFVSMTILPNSNVNCAFSIGSSLLHDTLQVMLQRKQTCGDVVFSGHTIMFMSASLVWVNNPLEWLEKRKPSVNLLTLIYSFVGVFSLIASSYHYTIDCVLSVITIYSCGPSTITSSGRTTLIARPSPAS
ncbi:hypothetical protein L0F63_003325, partial [Massospora cicadina]